MWCFELVNYLQSRLPGGVDRIENLRLHEKYFAKFLE